MAEPDLQLTRSFGWGVLFLSDRDAELAPVPTADQVASATPTAITILVHHAQDVSILDDDGGPSPLAQVTVCLTLADPPDDVALGFQGVVTLGSGILQLGDADGTYELCAGVGSWVVSLQLQPAEHADLVRLWLAPSDG